LLYLSEIAHLHGGRAYCFGGGLYVDPVFDDYQIMAIVARGGDQAAGVPVPATLPPPEAIDYYGQLDVPDSTLARPGDTVIFGFRCQAFVTRAYVVPVSGISSGAAAVQGIWNPLGYEVMWPDIPVGATASRGVHQPRSEENR
jgi:predicted amino acid racemase